MRQRRSDQRPPTGTFDVPKHASEPLPSRALTRVGHPKIESPHAPSRVRLGASSFGGWVSIAVMNWVWAHSPTSGNERLVLLALADACSRDDGTGCWPSAATVARKAAISDRTVRRVIARLEADGHLRVHRGGGRAGSTNSYTVVMAAAHNPCQIVTPDRTPGVTPVSGEGGHRCPGTPDMAVSPDPPENHQGTTTAREPETAAVSVRGDRDEAEAADVEAFFAALDPRWLLTVGQRRRLAHAVRIALAAGWTPQGLATCVGANAAGVRSPYAVLSVRLSSDELPAPPARLPPRPPWCGSCDQRTRHVAGPDGRPGRCPTCHPLRSGHRSA